MKTKRFPIRILITTDAIHKVKLENLAKSQGSTVSEVVRDLIDGKLQANGTNLFSLHLVYLFFSVVAGFITTAAYIFFEKHCK